MVIIHLMDHDDDILILLWNSLHIHIIFIRFRKINQLNIIIGLNDIRFLDFRKSFR